MAATRNALQDRVKSREHTPIHRTSPNHAAASSIRHANGISKSSVAPSSPSKSPYNTTSPSTSKHNISGMQSAATTFSPYRPSSSHSNHNQSMASPIYTRPSMSPTQGNRDVGPLAGIPASSNSASVPSTPFGQGVAQVGPKPSPYSSFSSYEGQHAHDSSTPNGHHISSLSPPPGSQAMSLSGLSPTKHSPRTVNTGCFGSGPALRPIPKLEPSPKLMGRSSPDAPIPPPVKLMTPEQEERRQRENELMKAATSIHGQQSGPAFGHSLPPIGSWSQATNDH